MQADRIRRAPVQRRLRRRSVSTSGRGNAGGGLAGRLGTRGQSGGGSAPGMPRRRLIRSNLPLKRSNSKVALSTARSNSQTNVRGRSRSRSRLPNGAAAAVQRSASVQRRSRSQSRNRSSAASVAAAAPLRRAPLNRRANSRGRLPAAAAATTGTRRGRRPQQQQEVGRRRVSVNARLGTARTAAVIRGRVQKRGGAATQQRANAVVKQRLGRSRTR